MNTISTFVGHSFTEDDKDLVRTFLDFFDRLKDLIAGFTWDHAEVAEPNLLSQKVRQKMAGKNLFIGICTAREHVLFPRDLRPSWFAKDTFKINQNDLQPKTSDWIMQEIGFAVAKDMSIMLLIEEGLKTPGGLQGDLEYISFSRKSPELSFNKILEMLKSLTPTTTASVALPVSGEAPQQDVSEQGIDRQDLDEEPNATWKRPQYLHALIVSILDNNADKESQIFNRYIESNFAKDEYERVDWQADRLFWRHELKKENILEDLKTLQKHYPSHSGVNRRLAILYRNYNDHGKAAIQFLAAAEHEKEDSQKVYDFCNAAVSAATLGDDQLSRRSIDQAKELNLSGDIELGILTGLARIADIRKDTHSYLAFMEAILAINIDDQKRRSTIAVKYFDTKENDLALYHYKMVVNDAPNDSWAWNNLGVALSRLSLAAKAVEAYRRAEELSNTLAMSNLANIYIDAGLLAEADMLCQKATKIEDYDHQIGNTIARTMKVRKEEDGKEIAVLAETSVRRSFYIKYAKACLDKRPTALPEIWQGEDCQLRVTLTQAQFEAIGHFEKQKERSVWETLVGQSTTKLATIDVKGTANLFGRAGKFRLSHTERGKTTTLLGDMMNPPAEGLLIISESYREIEFYEKKLEGTGRFYKWYCVE